MSVSKCTPPDLQASHFHFDLPQAQIALHPLETRDQSRLLVATRTPSPIQDRHFRDLQQLIPEGSFLVLNDSKVLPARIQCQKMSGGAAEVLLLEPIRPTPNPALALQSGSPGVWRGMVGGKNIHAGDVLRCPGLEIRMLEKEGNLATVEISWLEKKKPLAEVLHALGKIPLPPYLKRELVPEDSTRYQTVYASTEGSVAAPTAGLHFTDELRVALRKRSIQEARVTLHVGVGTFKPIEAERVAGHKMHSERFEVSLEFLEQLARSLKPSPGRPPVVAVGTTSLRTLESLYWLGARIIRNPAADTDSLEQWEAYAEPTGREILADEAVQALATRLVERRLERMVSRSRLMIVPGYSFKTADWLITNFHQPGSSLILLVAAWMGDRWREVYEHARSCGYRFLSYGDSSLLIRRG